MLPSELGTSRRSATGGAALRLQHLLLARRRLFRPAPRSRSRCCTPGASAVEEQYYLFFPLLLLLFWRFGTPRLRAGRRRCRAREPRARRGRLARRARRRTSTCCRRRAWELGVGALGAFLWHRPAGCRARPIAEAAAALGLALVLAACFLLSTRARRSPSLMRVAADRRRGCWSSSSPPRGTLVGRLLSLRARGRHRARSATAPISGTSRCSPSPGSPALDAPPARHRCSALCALTFAAGLARRWHFVERPFRNRSFLRPAAGLRLGGGRWRWSAAGGGRCCRAAACRRLTRAICATR